jgi:hypothetical protein
VVDVPGAFADRFFPSLAVASAVEEPATAAVKKSVVTAPDTSFVNRTADTPLLLDGPSGPDNGKRIFGIS